MSVGVPLHEKRPSASAFHVRPASAQSFSAALASAPKRKPAAPAGGSAPLLAVSRGTVAGPAALADMPPAAGVHDALLLVVIPACAPTITEPYVVVREQ